jgi:hypothetical protein
MYPVVVLSAFLIMVTASEAVAGCAHEKWACGMRAKETCRGLSDNDKVADCLEELNSDCEAEALACEKLPRRDYHCWSPDPMVIGEEKPAMGFCRERRLKLE